LCSYSNICQASVAGTPRTVERVHRRTRPLRIRWATVDSMSVSKCSTQRRRTGHRRRDLRRRKHRHAHEPVSCLHKAVDGGHVSRVATIATLAGWRTEASRGTASQHAVQEPVAAQRWDLQPSVSLVRCTRLGSEHHPSHACRRDYRGEGDGRIRHLADLQTDAACAAVALALSDTPVTGSRALLPDADTWI